MNSEIKKRLTAIEKRLSVLEEDHGLTGEEDNTIIKMDIVFPEADIDGLQFNETKVHAVFEKQDDGWYHSRDILFLSARNVKDDNSRDILTEYLNLPGDDSLREQLAYNLGVRQHNIEISLPPKNEGIKKYNGVGCRYWLNNPYSGSAASFCLCDSGGHSYGTSASGVGGCAPIFRVT